MTETAQCGATSKIKQASSAMSEAESGGGVTTGRLQGVVVTSMGQPGWDKDPQWELEPEISQDK